MDHPPQSDRPPQEPLRVRLVKGQEVSLGCGTLILIAIIVAVCSGAATRDLAPLHRRLDDLDHRLERIERRLEEISRNLKQGQ
jgi:hypothetical protein